jgi:hypothetical protein
LFINVPDEHLLKFNRRRHTPSFRRGGYRVNAAACRRAGTIVGLLFFSRFLFLHVPISSLSFFSPVCFLFCFFFVLT